MINKPILVFTFPNCVGGVSSFNFNILNFSTLKSQFYIKVILIKETEDTRPEFLENFNVDELIHFNYSTNENKYYVAKRLNSFIGDAEGALITDNIITIFAARRFASPKIIFHLLHDYFYVKQHIALEKYIDNGVAHSSFFSDAVFASNPNKWSNNVFYLPYGVQKQKIDLQIKNQKCLNLVFLGRLEKSKGVHYLFEIEKILANKNIKVNWSIIGKGNCKKALLNQWKHQQNVQFYEPDTTTEVFQILTKQDLFIFPTSFEGTPVSILECLSSGIVPIVNDLPGGIRDIVLDDIGFRCKLNNVAEFAEKIILLNSDRILLSTMQFNCLNHFDSNFQIEYNADAYFNLFANYNYLKNSVSITSNRIFSKLDHPFIPNVITQFLRRIKWL